MTLKHFCSAFVTLAATALTGCGPQDVTVTRIPKESENQISEASRTSNPVPASVAAANAAKTTPVTWKTPDGWEALPAGQMRVGAFSIKNEQGQQAEVTIIPLFGVSGTEVDNVNRWRSQVGQPPISQAEVEKSREPVQIGVTPGYLYDIPGNQPEGQPKTRIVAVSAKVEETTWFFKMKGDDLLVEKQKPVFASFLKTISFSESTKNESAKSIVDETLKTGSSNSAIGGPLLSAASDVNASASIPLSWQKVAPGSMQKAKFAVAGSDNHKAEVTVSSFPGDVGGLFANVNRWRGQLGLTPITENELPNQAKDLALGSIQAKVVDLAGSDKTTRMVVVVVSDSQHTTFYKLTGDADVVSKEKEALYSWIQKNP